VIIGAGHFPPFSGYADDFDDSGTSGFALYENSPTYGSPAGTGGLPSSRNIPVTVGGDTVQFQLQAYEDSNMLSLLNGNDNSESLYVDANDQVTYDKIAILAASGHGSATSTGSFEINFVGGTSSTPITYNAFDWFDGLSNIAIQGLKRVNTGTSTFEDTAA